MEPNKILKNSERFRKYHMYFEPVIIAGLDFNVIYKNLTAKSYLIRIQMKNNMRRVLNAENLEKLDRTVADGTMSVIDIDIPPPLNRCTVNIDEVQEISETGEIKSEKVIVFIFFSSLNIGVRGDNDGYNYIAGGLFKLTESYNMHREIVSGTIDYGLQALGGSVAANKDVKEIEKHLKFINSNYRKMARIQNHFNSYINNVKRGENENGKEYCNIVEFFKSLKSEIPKYLQSSGYSINFKIEDDIFVVKIYKKDFLLMNLIIITFALKYSLANTISAGLFIDEEGNHGIARYEFSMNEAFERVFGDKFNMEYLSEVTNIMDMNWLDLNLALIIATNNSSVMDIKTDSDMKKVTIDIIIGGKSKDILDIPELKNEFIDMSGYIKSEQIQKMFDAEFSVLDE